MPVKLRDFLCGVPTVVDDPIPDRAHMGACPDNVCPPWMICSKILYGVAVRATVRNCRTAEPMLPKNCTPDAIRGGNVTHLETRCSYEQIGRLPIDIEGLGNCPNRTVTNVPARRVILKQLPSAHGWLPRFLPRIAPNGGNAVLRPKLPLLGSSRSQSASLSAHSLSPPPAPIFARNPTCYDDVQGRVSCNFRHKKRPPKRSKKHPRFYPGMCLKIFCCPL